MSSHIESNDKGFVQGDTWHKNPLYVRQEEPVRVEQAIEVFDYPMEVRPAYGINDGLRYRIPGSNHIVRTDTASLIAPMVGNQFTLLNGVDFVKWVDSSILKPYPDLTIESVGTLYNGQTQFLSIVIDKYHVHGDESETLQRILFSHSIGKTGYVTNLNEVRVVCDNTRRAAIAGGVGLKKVAHTKGGEDKIKANIIELAKLKSHFAQERAKMDYLAGTNITVGEVDDVLESLFPAKDDNGFAKKGSRNIRKQYAVKHIFNGGQQGFLQGYDKSAYAFLNAITDYLGNQEVRSTKNPISIDMDNVTGTRAKLKDRAVEMLLAK